FWYFLTGPEWSAGFANAKYGIPTLFVGTLMVAVIAALVALPLGLTTAIYLSEYASPRMRAFVKPTLELLAGIPTVVSGIFAVTLACGAKRQFSLNPLDGVATMTSIIAQVAQGEVEVGSTTYNSLFAVAAVLFFMTLFMNVLAQWILRRYRMVYQ